MDGRRCTWCGVDNPGGAEVCSSCGARMVPLERTAEVSTRLGEASVPPIPPPPPTTAGAAGAGWSRMPPAPWTPPPPVRRPRAMLVGVGVVIGLLALGLLAKSLLFRSPIAFPDRLAGMSRDESIVSQQMTKMIEKVSDSVGLKVHAAIYGTTPMQPDLLVIAYEQGDAPPGMFDGFASGFTSTSGSAGVGESQTQTRGSVRYTCAPVLPSVATQASDPRSLCQWSDADTGGFIASMTVADAGAAIDLAEQVHDAVAG